MKQKVILFAVVMMALVEGAMGQWSQMMSCPGWNNPVSFTAGNTPYYYQGRGGVKNSNMFNVMTGETGVTWSNTIYTAYQMATVGASGCSGSSYGVIPNHDKLFAIMDSNSMASGHPVNRDPNTGDHLPFVPTQYNTFDTTEEFINTVLSKSIRIGDDCKAGSSSNDYGAAALYYNTHVTSDNAIMILYYAIVAENPDHGIAQNPVLTIRVLKQTANGNWIQISDTLALMLSTTSATNGGSVILESDYNTNGWHQYGSGSSKVVYKDWSKVMLNLSKHMYENLRIEVSISDCYYNGHYAYAYIAGECRQMFLTVNPECYNCEATLTAPRGMLQYEWYASEYGGSDPVTNFNPGEPDDYFTFRQLDAGTEQDSHYRYMVQYDDFRVLYRPNSAHQPIPVQDSIARRQTFRCRMTSALDPAKPFHTNLYVSVDRKHHVTVAANDATKGSVTGGGSYSDGATATLTATANCGYQFTQWNDGNTDNPRDIVVTQDTTLTAYFEAMTEFDATIASGQTLHFSINPGGTSVTITGHEANISGNLVIPATVNYCENNYYVTRIAADAFSSSSGLTSVTIPSTITYIGEYAFWYLVLDVYYLGTLSQWCDIDFNGYTFGGFNLYINNTLVTDVVIPEGIIQIKNSTFDRCISLTSITIPSSVTSIGAAAFISCTGVTSVILPESLTTIGSQAFENCSGLTEITCLAATVPSLEDRAFTSVNTTIPVYVPCGSVANYQAATGWSNFTNIQCISQSVTTDTMEIRTCTGQTLLFEVENGNHTAKVIGYVGQCAGTLTVPAWFSVDGERYEVTAIGPRAFENCTGLVSVILPRSITLVDTEAFKGCSALVTVDMK